MMQSDTPVEAHALVLTSVGRFAVFADTVTILREPDGVRMRTFQVVEEDFAVGATRYLGGWSWWRLDCEAGTADRLDFASVAVGGTEGPATRDGRPAAVAEPGGDAAGLLAVACGTAGAQPGVATLDEAVRVGRAALGD